MRHSAWMGSVSFQNGDIIDNETTVVQNICLLINLPYTYCEEKKTSLQRFGNSVQLIQSWFEKCSALTMPLLVYIQWLRCSDRPAVSWSRVPRSQKSASSMVTPFTGAKIWSKLSVFNWLTVRNTVSLTNHNAAGLTFKLLVDPIPTYCYLSVRNNFSKNWNKVQ